MSERRARVIGVCMVLIAAVAFSGKAIVAKLMYRTGEVDALTVIALRMALALPFFLVVAARASRTSTRPITTREKGALVLLGLLGYYAASLLDFLGLELISAGLERLILFLYPTMVAMMLALRARRLPTRRESSAILLSYGGIALVFAGDATFDAGDTRTLLGAGFVFASALCYALYIVGNGELAARIGTARFTAYAMLVSSFASLLHFALARSPSTLAFSSEIWAFALLLALGCTVLPTFMTSAGIERIGASHTAIISSVGPFATIVLEALVLDERITFFEVVGGVLVLVGVLLVSTAKKASP